MYKIGENLYMLDFLKLINGFLSFRFNGIDGDNLLIKLGVHLNERGQLVQDGIQSINSKNVSKTDLFLKMDTF